MKIIIYQRVFSSYRKPFFDYLSKEYNLKVLHSKLRNSIYQVNADYSDPIRNIKYGPKQTNIILLGFKKLLRFDPDIIIHEFTPSIASLFIVYIICRLRKSPFILWGHGFNHSRKLDTTSLAFKIRVYLVKLSNATIFYGHSSARVFKEYVDQSKLFVAPNSMDTNTLQNHYLELEQLGIKSIKRRNRILTKYNLIFLGRLVSSKRSLLIPEIVKEIGNILDLNELTFHVIGDGPDSSRLIKKIKDYSLENKIKLYGATYNTDIIGELLYISDLIIMPGRIGLTISHGFCYNVPIVSFSSKDHFQHGPEAEFLINNQTGFWVEAFSTTEMSIVVNNYLTNPILQKEIKMEIKQLVEKEYNIEQMINGFKSAISHSTSNGS